ncbi:hypothetical protein TNCT1_36040 [Streptomyces sp. 1-11]|nr:hypothetical protein TNCT1_36040 [Streptomyces sp. 1-11]
MSWHLPPFRSSVVTSLHLHRHPISLILLGGEGHAEALFPQRFRGPRPRPEHAGYGPIRATESRRADAISAFAGAVQFVYLNAAWFAILVTRRMQQGLLDAATALPPGLRTGVVGAVQG